jgi:exosortase/archaeosortase family protein
MIARRPAPGIRPRQIPPILNTLAVVWAILLLGCMLLQSPPSVALFRWVAEILALFAAAVLRLWGYDIVHAGIELRDRVTDHAIAVTDACDGSGLLVGVVATFAWLRGPPTKPLAIARAVSLAILGILAFNLLRVILLFVSIGTPLLMTAQHLFIAPLLSAVLVAGLASFGRGLKPAQVVRAPLQPCGTGWDTGPPAPLLSRSPTRCCGCYRAISRVPSRVAPRRQRYRHRR